MKIDTTPEISGNVSQLNVSSLTVNSRYLHSTSLTEFLNINEQNLSYHEMAEVPVREIDGLQTLHAHLEQLSDLSRRLKFINAEIRYVLKV
jgi:hypothetical protein